MSNSQTEKTEKLNFWERLYRTKQRPELKEFYALTRDKTGNFFCSLHEERWALSESNLEIGTLRLLRPSPRQEYLINNNPVLHEFLRRVRNYR